MAPECFGEWLKEYAWFKGRYKIELQSTFKYEPKKNYTFLTLTGDCEEGRTATVCVPLYAKDVEWMLNELHEWKRLNAKAETEWAALEENVKAEMKKKTTVTRGPLIAQGVRSYPIRFNYGCGVKEDEQ